MKPLAIFLVFVSGSLFGQQPVEPVNEQSLKLNERYLQMKAKSQTYGDYKVIKETTLDAFWKTTTDSVKKAKSLLTEAGESNTLLQAQLTNALVEMKQKDQTIEELTHAGTHINVLGLDLHKAVFVSFALLTIIGLLVVLGLISGRLKMIYHAMKDKMETVTILSQEFETYKRKALEKQMKLSRELQDERNRLLELRRA
jgi:hypothetical protein